MTKPYVIRTQHWHDIDEPCNWRCDPEDNVSVTED